MQQNFLIYMHKNKINGKAYIGQTHDYKKRCVPSNYKGCIKFYNAIKKYGWDNFQHIILEDNLTLEEANKKEEFYIKKYNTIQNGYNLKSGGLNNLYSEESKQKMSDSNNARPIICIETKKIYKNAVIIEKELGFKEPNIIACCKHRLITAYNYHWEYYDKNINYDNYKPLKKDKRKKKIKCIETNIVYESASAASRDTGVARPNISHCCLGELEKAGGYHWEFYTEQEDS